MPYLVTATWDDVPHLTEKQKSDLWGSIPAHERDARSKGIPTLGSGLIFPVAEEDIVVEPFALPKHWPQIGGMDFGYDHPFAAVKLAHDRDNDVVYITLDKSDFVDARRVVNGKDKASEIAAIARDYDAALKAIGYGEPKPADAAPSIPAPSKPPAVEAVPVRKPADTQGLFEWLFSLFTGGF
jgi:hypothetical protein